ncbi:hypothetical protein DV738_g1775, partial [Chaetothyriales sp. CBS 135597]
MLLADDVDRTATTRRPKKRAVAGPFAAMNVTEIPPRLRQQLESQMKSPAATGDKEKERGKQRKKQDDRPLFHALKMQRTLTPLSYGQRDKIKAKIDGITDFEQLGLLPAVASAVYSQALPGLTEYTPTPIQRLAIPALLAPSDGQQRPKKESEPAYDQFLLAAETGSGKTLAYLLPVIDAVKRQEELDKVEDAVAEKREAEELTRSRNEDIFHADPREDNYGHVNPKAGKPRALILLPSSELVAQVGKVVKAISHTVKFRSAPISAANTPTVIRNRDPNVLSRLQYLVCDEADSLLDKSFSETVTSIIDRAAPSLRQLILCSATIPRSLDRFLDHRYPQIKRLVTPKLHSITRRVQLGVIDIEKEPYRGSRQLACADVIWQIGKAEHDDTHSHHSVKCIMVFVNEREEAETLAGFLASKGIEAVALTRDTSEQRSADILAAFTSQAVQEILQQLFLVTTDLGSRGIDTLAVRHVILYDVPHTTIDFVHRLGRVGRMGRRGRAIVLVGRRDRKDVVREVRDAMFQGKALI